MANLMLLSCLAFLRWVFRADRQYRTFPSKALWIPALWIFLLASRPPSLWLEIFNIHLFTVDGEGGESNPINTIVIFSLIFAAIVVLVRRRMNWSSFFGANKALTCMYLYFALTTLWAPETFVSLRRLIKDFGNVLIILVMFTEVHPWQSCRTLLVRISYLFISLSLLTAKFFPDIGRNAARAGDTLYTGLTTQKNSLGQAAFLCILFLVWDLIEISKQLSPKELRRARIIRFAIIGMGVMLMSLANSSTAITCLILGVGLLFLLNRAQSYQNGRKVIGGVILLAILAFGLEEMFHITQSIVEMFGKDMTFTGRTLIWDEAIRLMDRPLLGIGFYEFWYTPRAAILYENLGDLIHVKTVHNGFVEVYLDGGQVGLVFLGVLLIATLKKAYNSLSEAGPRSLPLIFFVIGLIYNNSESSYFRMNLLWFLLLLFSTTYHHFAKTSLETSSLPSSVVVASQVQHKRSCTLRSPFIHAIIS